MRWKNHIPTACVLTYVVTSIIWFLIDRFPEKDLYDITIMHCLVFLNISELLKN